MYEIEYKNSAVKELEAIESKDRKRIIAEIKLLAANPRPMGVTKLKGSDPVWRIRVGKYRAIYEIYDKRLIVSVVKVAHRKDAYNAY